MGGDRTRVPLEAGDWSLIPCIPGPGWRWGDEYFYPMRVVAPGGVSPAALGVDRRDVRTLGVHVAIAAAKFRRTPAAATPAGK